MQVCYCNFLLKMLLLVVILIYHSYIFIINIPAVMHVECYRWCEEKQGREENAEKVAGTSTFFVGYCHNCAGFILMQLCCNL